MCNHGLGGLPGRDRAHIRRLLTPVGPEIYARVGYREKIDADLVARLWLSDLINDDKAFRWSWHGPESVRSGPVPQRPCVSFSGSREFSDRWVPTLFLMTGHRGSDQYYQWATCGPGPPPLGRDATGRLNRLAQSLSTDLVCGQPRNGLGGSMMSRGQELSPLATASPRTRLFGQSWPRPRKTFRAACPSLWPKQSARRPTTQWTRAAVPLVWQRTATVDISPSQTAVPVSTR